jgi:hypothetical protein
MVASPFLLMTHFLRYVDIHRSDDLRITSHGNNSSILNRDEEFRTRDIDASSLDTKPNHDITMTLSELRTTFHSVLPHCKSAAIKMKRVVSISSPGPYNSMFLLTTLLMMHSWISV